MRRPLKAAQTFGSSRDQPLRPFRLPGRIGDQGVSIDDLQLQIGQAPALGMNRDGVVGEVADEIGFVVADHQTALLLQQAA